MLKKVGNPGGPGQLVPRADPVPDLEGDDRASVVFKEKGAEAVVKRSLQDIGRSPGPPRASEE